MTGITSDPDSAVDSIHNYYEHLVLHYIAAHSTRAKAGDLNFLADVACVALNRLPPRYIRHNVDMSFFMSPQELQEIEAKVASAVKDAMTYVESRENENRQPLPSGIRKKHASAKPDTGKKTTGKKRSNKLT